MALHVRPCVCGAMAATAVSVGTRAMMTNGSAHDAVGVPSGLFAATATAVFARAATGVTVAGAVVVTLESV